MSHFNDHRYRRVKQHDKERERQTPIEQPQQDPIRQLMGDPAPGRSALDEKLRQEKLCLTFPRLFS